MANCADWLGNPTFEETEHTGALLVECTSDGEGGGGGQGGQGGQGGAAATTPPALRTFCEAVSAPDLNGSHPIYHCVKPLLDDPCAPGSAEALEACVTKPIPCAAEPVGYGCADLLAECPELTAGTCYWAMSAATNRNALEECFAEPVADEDCAARFLRCAWQL